MSPKGCPTEGKAKLGHETITFFLAVTDQLKTAKRKKVTLVCQCAWLPNSFELVFLVLFERFGPSVPHFLYEREKRKKGADVCSLVLKESAHLSFFYILFHFVGNVAIAVSKIKEKMMAPV